MYLDPSHTPTFINIDPSYRFLGIEMHPNIGGTTLGEDDSKRSQEKIIGKDHGRSEKSTKISTEMPTELPTKKQSTELPTEKQSTEMSTKKVTDAMFRTTSLRSIYKSMPIADDYQCVWYRTKITDIV
ncbi:hypothetical protein BDD12DRAFT_803380 [Trichophaea hybrida]|nr:hypothetical protein BDD12DRAFT_803380 [Trichophaea hybrida]